MSNPVVRGSADPATPRPGASTFALLPPDPLQLFRHKTQSVLKDLRHRNPTYRLQKVTELIERRTGKSQPDSSSLHPTPGESHVVQQQLSYLRQLYLEAFRDIKKDLDRRFPTIPPPSAGSTPRSVSPTTLTASPVPAAVSVESNPAILVTPPVTGPPSAAILQQPTGLAMADLQDILQGLADSQRDASDSLIEGLSNLNAHAVKQTIPLFTGEIGGQSVDDWFKVADQIATNAGWTDEQKLTLFQQRLAKPASSFNDRLTATEKADFATWKRNFTNGFKDEPFRQTIKEKLENIKQDMNERVRDLRIRLDNLFDQVYGEEPAPIVRNQAQNQGGPGQALQNQGDPNAAAPDPAAALNRHVLLLRDERKRSIFMKGVKRQLVDGIWSRV